MTKLPFADLGKNRTNQKFISLVHFFNYYNSAPVNSGAETMGTGRV
ncbi:hypothetical protein PN437_12095 [Microcystis aeruginosa CS-564/01]|nr:hypothetical protein [Microcystis aeruginosa]MDB9425627.1 hypothetical protein [Microcystis aeruginosa CS-564/01]